MKSGAGRRWQIFLNIKFGSGLLRFHNDDVVVGWVVDYPFVTLAVQLKNECHQSPDTAVQVLLEACSSAGCCSGQSLNMCCFPDINNLNDTSPVTAASALMLALIRSI